MECIEIFHGVIGDFYRDYLNYCGFYDDMNLNFGRELLDTIGPLIWFSMPNSKI